MALFPGSRILTMFRDPIRLVRVPLEWARDSLDAHPTDGLGHFSFVPATNNCRRYEPMRPHALLARLSFCLITLHLLTIVALYNT